MKILLSPEHKAQIAKELKVTTQSVRMSLENVFKSKMAKKIRLRAKELLLEESKKEA